MPAPLAGTPPTSSDKKGPARVCADGAPSARYFPPLTRNNSTRNAHEQMDDKAGQRGNRPCRSGIARNPPPPL